MKDLDTTLPHTRSTATILSLKALASPFHDAACASARSRPAVAAAASWWRRRASPRSRSSSASPAPPPPRDAPPLPPLLPESNSRIWVSSRARSLCSWAREACKQESSVGVTME